MKALDTRSLRDHDLRTVLHIPHSSTEIPADLRGDLLLKDDELKQELLALTDHFTDELFPAAGRQALRFPVSRLILDPERYPLDADEAMAARGMGVIYTRDSHGRRLRHEPGTAVRERLLKELYRPHHDALETLVQQALLKKDGCLLLDCHSFPSRPLPCDLDQDADRPDFCLGTSPSSTPEALVMAACEFLEAQGYTVAINRPYAGVLVPAAFSSNAHVLALMIEVNRRLYMDESTGETHKGFEEIRQLLRELVLRLESFARSVLKKQRTKEAFARAAANSLLLDWEE
jgi:N-formylglutamate deformylase